MIELLFGKTGRNKGQPGKAYTGFTLAELLISLAILGVIATFTIPKILSTQQNSRYNAAAKEMAAMLSAAVQQAKLEGKLTGSSKLVDLAPYMNYVQKDTTSTINDRPAYSSQACSNTGWVCYKFHNGGILWGGSGTVFAGTSSLNAIYVNFDPDGGVDAPNSGVTFLVYYDGSIATIKNAKLGTVNSNGALPAEPAGDPNWFSW